MGLRRHTHKGRARAVVRGKQPNRKPPHARNTTPFFSFQNFPLIRKKLVHRVNTCPHRKNTGKITTAPCCRSEQGRVYQCLLYGHQPAKLFDCLNCKKQEATENKEKWILPLIELSRGEEPKFDLHEIQELTKDPTSTAGNPLPGHLKQ